MTPARSISLTAAAAKDIDERVERGDGRYQRRDNYATCRSTYGPTYHGTNASRFEQRVMRKLSITECPWIRIRCHYTAFTRAGSVQSPRLLGPHSDALVQGPQGPDESLPLERV